MKQGWIQVQSNGTQEALAPKTMANMVYVNDEQTKTLSEALSESTIGLFSHSMTEQSDIRVHNFTGPQGFAGMCRAWMTAELQSDDQIQVNGQTVDCYYMGTDNLFSLMADRWVFFVLDQRGIDFLIGEGGIPSRMPIYTYTGDHELIDDGNENWRIKFYTSGTLRLARNVGEIQAFLLGGGASGGTQVGRGVKYGGGGGYMKTVPSYIPARGIDYQIIIGAGGVALETSCDPQPGSATSAFGYSAKGGGQEAALNRASGASGGGGTGQGSSSTYGCQGGTDGSNGQGSSPGQGQGTTTREFGETSGTLYAGGGGTGGELNNSGGAPGDETAGRGGSANQAAQNALPNRGGGGGGGGGYYQSNYNRGGTGGSGIVVIRNRRQA